MTGSNIVSNERELDSDTHIKGMIDNIDAYRNADKSLAEHLLIMDLQSLREIIRKEKQALQENDQLIRVMTDDEARQMIKRIRDTAEQFKENE